MQDNFFDLSGYVYSRKTGFAFCTQMEQCYNDSAHLICKTSKKMHDKLTSAAQNQNIYIFYISSSMNKKCIQSMLLNIFQHKLRNISLIDQAFDFLYEMDPKFTCSRREQIYELEIIKCSADGMHISLHIRNVTCILHTKRFRSSAQKCI